MNSARATKCVKVATKSTARSFCFPRDLFSGNFRKFQDMSGNSRKIQEISRQSRKFQQISGNFKNCAQENFDCGDCVLGNATDLFFMWTPMLRHVERCEIFRAIHNTFKTNDTSRENMKFRAANRGGGGRAGGM